MSHSSDRHGHGHAHTATNGASLEDCHANFFALVRCFPEARGLFSASIRSKPLSGFMVLSIKSYPKEDLTIFYLAMPLTWTNKKFC